MEHSDPLNKRGTGDSVRPVKDEKDCTVKLLIDVVAMSSSRCPTRKFAAYDKERHVPDNSINVGSRVLHSLVTKEDLLEKKTDVRPKTLKSCYIVCVRMKR